MEAKTQAYFFQDDGRIPNHPDFSLVVYQNVLKDTGQAERIVNRHGWSNSWSGSVFPYTIIITAIRMKS